MTKEELINEIKVLEAKYNKSRNTVERAELGERIKLNKKKIKKLEEKPLVKDYIPTKDAPSVADKGKNRRVVRGMINNSNLGITVDL